MGYNFTIGNAYISKCDESISIEARAIRESSAPSAGTRILSVSSVSVGYGEWDSFCRNTRTTKLFYGDGYVNGRLEWATDFHREEPYLYRHPGAALIIPADLDFIRQSMRGLNISESEYSYLQWLEFWMDYALTNCEHPVFVNS